MSQPDAPRNEVGVASLLVGLVALLTCWLLIGVPFGIAAATSPAGECSAVKRTIHELPSRAWS